MSWSVSVFKMMSQNQMTEKPAIHENPSCSWAEMVAEIGGRKESLTFEKQSVCVGKAQKVAAYVQVTIENTVLQR